MNQTLTSIRKFLNTDSSVRILCFHSNLTHQLQIIRLINSPDSPWERVIFPGQCLLFEALPEAKLEIKFSERRSVSIPCSKLRVTERNNVIFCPQKEYLFPPEDDEG